MLCIRCDEGRACGGQVVHLVTLPVLCERCGKAVVRWAERRGGELELLERDPGEYGALELFA